MDVTAARAAHYRQRAAEVGRLAMSMHEPEHKDLLEGVAQDYLNLADMLDRLSGRVRGTDSSGLKC